MTTTVTFSLDTILAGKATTPGVNIYAYAFDTNGLQGSPLQIVGDGTVAASPQFTFDSLDSGNIVIVTQQAGGTALPMAPAFNDIASIANAKTGNYRYEVVELSLSGSSTDQGDLTNIVQFGAPISMTVKYTGGATQTRGYGVTGQELVGDLAAIATANKPYAEWIGSSPFSDQRETLTVATNLAPGMQATGSSSDWDTYVTSISDDTRIAYFYAGATNNTGQFTVNPSFFYYTIKHDGDFITLTPVENSAFSAFLTQQGIPYQASSAVSRMPATSHTIAAYGTGSGLT